MLKSLAWTPSGGLVADPSPDRFAEFIANPEAVLWVDMEAAKAKEIAILRKPFGVAPTAVDECRDYTALPKVEDYGAYILVILHRIQFDESSRRMNLREIDFLVGKNWIVTVREDSSTSVAEVHKRLVGTPDIFREGPGRVMADIIEAMTNRYFPTIEFLEKEIDDLEESMIEKRDAGDPFGRILSLRRSVVALRRSLVPQREVISRLAREEFRLSGAPTALRFRSIHDELYWILTELEIYRELLTSAFEGFAAMASNRLATISNRMNRVMEKLSRFATIFMPLTLITGVYGMNFEHMPELKWPWAYPVLLVVIVGLGFGLASYFKRTLPPIAIEPEEGPPPLVTRVWKRGEGASRKAGGRG
ncbi:MAG: magnesium/cobalt transporter CorA [Planctomycetes bacterium]|nr:magnesium/cobalt transporter CorA [Planctomycetota bacterium]